jgi:hypothetical protein
VLLWESNVTSLSSAAVVGLGYIGLPTAVSLATGGLEVVGVDVNPDIVERVNRGEATFAEPDLSVAVSGAAAMGRLRAQRELSSADGDRRVLPDPQVVTASSAVRPPHPATIRPRLNCGCAGRKSAPKKDAARARVIELRREGLSVYEISTRLGQEQTPLGRTAVSDILCEEGFGRLLRGPEPEASVSPATSGRDTRLPAAAVIDFAALPGRCYTTMAGLLLTIPDLVALDLPAMIKAAG